MRGRPFARELPARLSRHGAKFWSRGSWRAHRVLLWDAVKASDQEDVERWLIGYNPMLGAGDFGRLPVGAVRTTDDGGTEKSVKKTLGLPDALPATLLPATADLAARARSAPLAVLLGRPGGVGCEGRPRATRNTAPRRPTDLLTGERIILDHGSLAEAMRSSITVPFLYAPLERDSMELVDGGLLSNVPVDVARAMGCDIVIAVNSTSVLNREAQLGAPWEVADQIMTIMMQAANQAQLKNADVVITPDLGYHSVANFNDVDTLEVAGETPPIAAWPRSWRLSRQGFAAARGFG